MTLREQLRYAWSDIRGNLLSSLTVAATEASALLLFGLMIALQNGLGARIDAEVNHPRANRLHLSVDRPELATRENRLTPEEAKALEADERIVRVVPFETVTGTVETRGAGAMEVRFRSTVKGDPDLARPRVTSLAGAPPAGGLPLTVTRRSLGSMVADPSLRSEAARAAIRHGLPVVFSRKREGRLEKATASLSVAAVIPDEACGDPDHRAFLPREVLRRIELWKSGELETFPFSEAGEAEYRTLTATRREPRYSSCRLYAPMARAESLDRIEKLLVENGFELSQSRLDIPACIVGRVCRASDAGETPPGSALPWSEPLAAELDGSAIAVIGTSLERVDDVLRALYGYSLGGTSSGARLALVSEELAGRLSPARRLTLTFRAGRGGRPEGHAVRLEFEAAGVVPDEIPGDAYLPLELAQEIASWRAGRLFATGDGTFSALPPDAHGLMVKVPADREVELRELASASGLRFDSLSPPPRWLLLAATEGDGLESALERERLPWVRLGLVRARLGWRRSGVLRLARLPRGRNPLADALAATGTLSAAGALVLGPDTAARLGMAQGTPVRVAAGRASGTPSVLELALVVSESAGALAGGGAIVAPGSREAGAEREDSGAAARTEAPSADREGALGRVLGRLHEAARALSALRIEPAHLEWTAWEAVTAAAVTGTSPRTGPPVAGADWWTVESDDEVGLPATVWPARSVEPPALEGVALPSGRIVRPSRARRVPVPEALRAIGVLLPSAAIAREARERELYLVPAARRELEERFRNRLDAAWTEEESGRIGVYILRGGRSRLAPFALACRAIAGAQVEEVRTWETRSGGSRRILVAARGSSGGDEGAAHAIDLAAGGRSFRIPIRTSYPRGTVPCAVVRDPDDLERAARCEAGLLEVTPGGCLRARPSRDVLVLAGDAPARAEPVIAGAERAYSVLEVRPRSSGERFSSRDVRELAALDPELAVVPSASASPSMLVVGRGVTFHLRGTGGDDPLLLGAYPCHPATLDAEPRARSLVLGAALAARLGLGPASVSPLDAPRLVLQAVRDGTGGSEEIRVPFRVTGIIRGRSNGPPALAHHVTAGELARWAAGELDYNPYFDAFQERAAALERRAPRHDRFAVHVRRIEELGAVEAELRGRFEPRGFRVESSGATIARLLALKRLATGVCLFVVVVPLAACSGTIFCTLLALVARKRREIGVLQALGLTPDKLLGIYLLEAAVLGTAGGLAGLLGAAILSGPVAHVVEAHLGLEDGSGLLHFGWGTAVLSLLAALAVSLAGAFAPAWKAAESDPIDALKATT